MWSVPDTTPSPPEMALRRPLFLDQLEEQKAYCEGRSPLYARLLESLRKDLSEGEAAWFDRLARTWKYRPFETPYEAPLLLLACLHFEALDGEPRLQPVFPTCGGSAQSSAGDFVLEYLKGAPDAFWDRLGEARLQTNEARRSVGWLLTACVGFLTRGTPFHLVDMGTSAGLNLIGDYLERPWTLMRADGEPAEEPEHWRDMPYPVLTRLGLDARPIALEEAEERLWLKACVWPDDPARLERFARAADLFVKLARDASGPRLEMCAFEEMPRRASQRIKPHPEEGILFFNSQASDFLTGDEYQALTAAVAEALAPWEDRGFWAELELPRGDRKAFHELRVHRLIEGRLESRVLAMMTAHPSEVRLLPGWDFLRPLKPLQRPRFTVEDPVKTLEPGLYKFPPAPKDA